MKSLCRKMLKDLERILLLNVNILNPKLIGKVMSDIDLLYSNRNGKCFCFVLHRLHGMNETMQLFWKTGHQITNRITQRYSAYKVSYIVLFYYLICIEY